MIAPAFHSCKLPLYPLRYRRMSVEMQNDPEVIALCQELMEALQPVRDCVLLQGSDALEAIAHANNLNDHAIASLEELQQWETMWVQFQSMTFFRFILGLLRRYWAKKLRSPWKAQFPISSQSTTNSIH